MMSPRIAYVAQGSNPPPTADGEGFKYLRLVSELEQHLGIQVARFGQLQDAVDFDFILLSGADFGLTLQNIPERMHDKFKRRVIPLHESRSKIFTRLLERYMIPGAIDGFSLLEWEVTPQLQTSARGLYGFSEIAPLIGANCILYHSEHYCYFQSPMHQGLPHLLADYLSMLNSRGYCRIAE